MLRCILLGPSLQNTPKFVRMLGPISPVFLFSKCYEAVFGFVIPRLPGYREIPAEIWLSTLTTLCHKSVLRPKVTFLFLDSLIGENEKAGGGEPSNKRKIF